MDDMAFNAMPQDASGQLFTESYYNTQATPEEQNVYNRKAYRFLNKMYKQDVEAGTAKDLDYDQYTTMFSPDLMHERLGNRADMDPEYYGEMGDLLFNVYEGDFDQMRASASAWGPENDAVWEAKAKEGTLSPAPMRRGESQY